MVKAAHYVVQIMTGGLKDRGATLKTEALAFETVNHKRHNMAMRAKSTCERVQALCLYIIQLADPGKPSKSRHGKQTDSTWI